LSGGWRYIPIEQQGWRGRVWYDFGVHLTATLWFPGRMRVTGLENIPEEGPFILAPNHVSYADPPVIGAAVWPRRRLAYMGKSEIFEIPVFRTLIRSWCFPVRRGAADQAAIRNALCVLRRGGALTMFPEGGLAPNEDALLPGETGVAMVAARAGVPVVPVATVGMTRVLPCGSFLLRPRTIEVRIGQPLDLPTLRVGRPGRAEFVDATHEIMGAIAGLLGKPHPGVSGTESAVWPDGADHPGGPHPAPGPIVGAWRRYWR
jgi:1-acyl-sn-glycerol-3-phosphate acyltransferase